MNIQVSGTQTTTIAITGDAISQAVGRAVRQKAGVSQDAYIDAGLWKEPREAPFLPNVLRKATADEKRAYAALVKVQDYLSR